MELTEFQHLVHLIATPVMIVLYTVRLVMLMRSRLVKDRSPDPKGDITKGIIDAFLTIAMPWKMESTRKHWTHYLEFVIFHIGLLLNISLAYLITYAAGIMTDLVRLVFVVSIALSLLVGIFRFVRRFTQPDLKIISSFDDYFSLFLVLLFNATGILILRNIEWGSYAYFVIVGLFLVYAPFSKIHHYLYYPFARVFYGTEFSRKGILNQEVKNV
jgi:hypothetical protein